MGERLKKLRRWVSQARKGLGPKGFFWLLMGVVISLTIVGVEYGVAGFLQLFLVSLGYVDPKVLPKWLAPYSDLSTLALCSALIGIGAIRAIALFFSAYSNDQVQELMNARWRFATIYEMLMMEGRSYLSASEVQYRFGEIFGKARHFIYVAICFFVNGTQIVFLIVGMFLVSWKESVVGLLGLLLTSILVFKINRTVKKLAQTIPGVQKQISQGVERVSRNWLFIRISRTQKLEYEKLIDRVSDYYRNMTKGTRLTSIMMGIPPFLGMIIFAFIIFLSRNYFKTDPASILIFLYLFLRLIQYLGNEAQYFGWLSAYYPHFRIATNNYFALSDEDLHKSQEATKLLYRASAQTPEQRAFAEGAGGFRRPDILKAPGIGVENLEFAWIEGATPVLKNFNLQIEAGSIFGIVGASGSGKSTLLLLILGMLDPSSGRVRINGENPGEYFSRHSLQLGYVGAEPFLIEGSIRENMIYGLPYKVSDEEIMEALEKAQLTQTIRAARGGLDYELDENGSGLSTGQRQRLSLARALLRRPAVLVLDEASANLDAVTESDIAKTIKTLEGQCTVIIVSHRSGILEAASKVVNLEQIKKA